MINMTYFGVTSKVFLACILASVNNVFAKCPDINIGVNCSFESNEQCMKAYQMADEHGLQWKQTTGNLQVVVNNHYPRGGGYQSYEILITQSPQNSYLYVQGTDDVRAHGLWTDLVSPPFIASGNGCLYFLFHNNVCGDDSETDLKTLKVYLKHTATVVPVEQQGKTNKSSPQGNIPLREFPCIDTTNWYRARIPVNDVNGIYSIVFSAQHTGFTNQTIGIDHVMYSDKSCSVRDDSKFDAGDCDFEDFDMCGYQQSSSEETNLRWTAVQKEMINHQRGPISTMKAGNFLMLWSNEDRHLTKPLSVSVVSPKVTINADGCLTLTYFNGRSPMENNDASALLVSYIDTVHAQNHILYRFPVTLGGNWLKAIVPLPKGRYALNFTASVDPPYGFGEHDIIGVDDIEIHQRSCDKVKCDDIICDTSSSTTCKGRGTCAGRGLKHYSCDCTAGYMGRYCEDAMPSYNSRGRVRNYQYG